VNLSEWSLVAVAERSREAVTAADDTSYTVAVTGEVGAEANEPLAPPTTQTTLVTTRPSYDSSTPPRTPR